MYILKGSRFLDNKNNTGKGIHPITLCAKPKTTTILAYKSNYLTQDNCHLHPPVFYTRKFDTTLLKPGVWFIMKKVAKMNRWEIGLMCYMNYFLNFRISLNEKSEILVKR